MDIFSQSSTVSTIASDIIENQDDDFLHEIDRVNNLFFVNVLTVQNSYFSTAQETNDSADDSVSDQESSESVVQPELRGTDVTEESVQ